MTKHCDICSKHGVSCEQGLFSPFGGRETDIEGLAQFYVTGRIASCPGVTGEYGPETMAKKIKESAEAYIASANQEAIEEALERVKDSVSLHPPSIEINR